MDSINAIEGVRPVDEQFAPIEGSFFRIIWRRFRKRRSGMIALFTLLILGLSVIIVPAISPFGYNQVSPTLPYAAAWTLDPNGNVHILGTDVYGRDNFTRLFFGGQVSLIVALIAAISVVLVGSIVGGIAGFYGGWVDNVLMRITDFMLALPLLPMFVFGVVLLRSNKNLSPDLYGVVYTLTLTFCDIRLDAGICRLVRASLLSLRQRTFVEAAVALGATDRRIIFRQPVTEYDWACTGRGHLRGRRLYHLGVDTGLLRNRGQRLCFPIMGQFDCHSLALCFPVSELQPNTGDTGLYAFAAQRDGINITVLSFNYIGDALRDAMDPHRVA